MTEKETSQLLDMRRRLYPDEPPVDSRTLCRNWHLELKDISYQRACSALVRYFVEPAGKYKTGAKHPYAPTVEQLKEYINNGGADRA